MLKRFSNDKLLSHTIGYIVRISGVLTLFIQPITGKGVPCFTEQYQKRRSMGRRLIDMKPAIVLGCLCIFLERRMRSAYICGLFCVLFFHSLTNRLQDTQELYNKGVGS